MSNAEDMPKIGIETVKVRLQQTEMLINIFRPVLQYQERESTRTDGPLNDAALNVYYTTVDPQLAAIRIQSSPNGYKYYHIVDFLTAFHVLNRIQETWLVKFTAETENDTWGRVFLDKLKGFGAELQNLTNYIHTMVTSRPMVQPEHLSDEYFKLKGVWDNTAMKFFCLLLFLFDVGITPEAEQYEYYDDAQFQESPAFSSTSTFRERILTEAAFIIHLEVCAWKVLTVSHAIREPYQLTVLAIPYVCDELGKRIVAIRDAYALQAGVARRSTSDHVNTDRDAIDRAIKLALDWRSKWESAGVGGLQENYRNALANLQHENIINLALMRRNQPKDERNRTGTPSKSTGHAPRDASREADVNQLDMRVLLEQLKNIAM